MNSGGIVVTVCSMRMIGFCMLANAGLFCSHLDPFHVHLAYSFLVLQLVT